MENKDLYCMAKFYKSAIGNNGNPFCECCYCKKAKGNFTDCLNETYERAVGTLKKETGVELFCIRGTGRKTSC